ncbi:GTPase activating protein, partial [Kappamyces sp. JEL0680]
LKQEWKRQLDSELLAENLFRIEKDVVRTDRNLSFYPKTRPQDAILSLGEQINGNSRLSQLRDILMTYTSKTLLETGASSGFVQARSVHLTAGNGGLCLHVSYGPGQRGRGLLLLSQIHGGRLAWLMRQTRQENFLEDGSGINRQLDLLRHLIKTVDPGLYAFLPSHLFCAFRWLLVLFRREFSFKDTRAIWDQLLANYCFSDWQIFICVALLHQNKDAVMAYSSDPDELLRYFHSQCLQYDLATTLAIASQYYEKLEALCFARGFPLAPLSKVSLKTVLNQLDNNF